MSFLHHEAQPFHFLRAQDDELPLGEALVIRDGIVSFASSFARSSAGLDDDVKFLKGLALDDCAYGAATLPVHPFLCELGSTEEPTARQTLAALAATRFGSEHIADLDAQTIPFPGYHPSRNRSADHDNDEIHDDPLEQHLFARPEDGGSVAHDALRTYVPHLWYVGLHTLRKPASALNLPIELQMPLYFSDHVILFAVGRSHDRLVGVISHQSCHNLCD